MAIKAKMFYLMNKIEALCVPVGTPVAVNVFDDMSAPEVFYKHKPTIDELEFGAHVDKVLGIYLSVANAKANI